MTYTLAELAKQFSAELRGNARQSVERAASLEQADENSISFLSDTRFRSALAETGAAAVILKAEDADQYDGNKLITSNPQVLFTKIATLLHPYPKHPAAIDPDAKIAANVVPGDTVYIGANTVISTGCRLGQRVQVGANCFIGAGVEIGDDCVIHPGVCIHDKTRIGRDCIIQSGVVIGSDGFGLANDRGEWLRMPQIGRVIVGNNVDIGANSTIDRGSMDDTVLGNGVKLDNQVQIAHNVKVGDHTAMASFVGIAGSTRIGKRCMLGGRCNINGHIDIVDDVVVFADSFISHSILETGTYSSVIVARKVSKWRRIQGRLQQLDEFAKRLRRLEHKVNKQGGSIS